MTVLPSDRLARTVGQSVFGEDVLGYEQGRIGYPAELYEAIASRVSEPLDTVLEIGPGTGLATRDILDRLNPAHMVLVEVDSALASHLRTRFPDPRLTVVHCDFGSAPIEPNVQLACSAASFHWLEPRAAFARLQNLIVPGGTLALWWNTYRVSGIGDPFADAVAPLLADIELPPSEGLHQHYSLDVDHHRSAIEGAGFEGFEPFLFRRERLMTADQVHALYASYSFVRALPAKRRSKLLDDVVQIAERDFGGTAPNVTLSALYLANAPG